MILVGGTPVPVEAPPEVVLDDVMNGYVPWSMSSMVPCAPSNNTLAPASIQRDKSSAVSVMYGASQPAKRRYGPRIPSTVKVSAS